MSSLWRRRIRPWCWRRGRFSRLEPRLRSGQQVRRGEEAGNLSGRSRSGHERPRLGARRGLSPVAAMREGASDSEAPGSESCGLQGLPGDLLAKVTPRQVHTGQRAWRIRPRGDLRVEPPTRESTLRGEPRCSEFRLFVTPLSPVFVPNLASYQLESPHCVSGSDSLWTLSLSFSSPCFSVFLTPFCPSGYPQSPNVTAAP